MMAVVIAVVIVVVITIPVVYLALPSGPTQTTTTQTTTIITTTTSLTTTTASQLKIGFITTSDETDLGWSQSAVDAADYVTIKYGAEADVSRWGVLAVGDTPRVISDYVAAGYDTVFLNGAEFSVYAVDAALAAPNVKIIAVNPPFTEDECPTNVMGVFERSDEPQYLAGILAGYMTETKSIGAIFGENYTPLWMESLAYTIGAHSVDPTIEVNVVMAGSWVDATLGYTLATAMIEEKNVDIIDQVADVTGRGVISAVVDKNKWVIGCYGDQFSWAPNNTLTSYELDYKPLMDIYMEIISSGQWDQYGGKFWNLGLAAGTGYLVPFKQFVDPLIPAEVKAAIEEGKQAILDGTITLPGQEFFPYPHLTMP